MVKRIPLGDLCHSKVATIPASQTGEIRYIDISSINNQSKRIENTQVIDAEEAPSRAKQLVRQFDILVSTVRPNLNAVAVVDIDDDTPLVASTGYCVLRCKNEAHSRYVYHFCQSPYFIEDMTKQATGASYPAVSAAIVRNSLVPLPAEDEIQRISRIFDNIASLIAGYKTALDNLDLLVKSRFIEMFGDLANPACVWPQVKLVEACADPDDIKCGPFGTQLSKDEYRHEGIALWEIPQINSQFKANPTHYLDSDKASELDAYSIRPGDIAMSRKGNVGRCAVFPCDYSPGIIHSDVLRIRVDSGKVSPVFMMYQLHYSGGVQRQIEQVSTGAIMAGINVTKLKSITVHLPPLELQEQYAAFIAQTDKSKVEIQNALNELEILKKSLMQQYFG